MTNMSVVRNISEYVDKAFLLTNRERSGLFVLPNSSSHILLKMGENANHVVGELTNNVCRPINITLRGVGERYLHLKDPTLNTVLKYLVTPEMEVERIFNNLRFKYLNAIYLSKFVNPQQYIKYRYNKAFQTLAGLTIYQGNPPQRKANDSYWQDAGFTIEAKEQNWSKEQKEMQTIVSILKQISAKPMSRRIVMRVEASTCELPAAEAQKKYSLSIFQHLTLAGLVGMREGDVRYDFSTPADVTQLFARGRICRKLMKEHLFGEKSSLMRNRLVEGINGSFGESIQITNLGTTALYGKLNSKSTYQDLQKRVKKNTLFDIEEPKIKKESLQLPDMVMEAIRSLLFSESRKGKQIRKSWHLSLPAAWGTPTGSTVLLYGPPGTGKTLTAQYLASELKLPLLKIDAARVLSCWVGESEQNVRRIFDDYSTLQKELGSAPVLLLNEADQLLGSRGAGSHAVDRMNNNMQNLFLEGLERFSGILVATTNRRDLLDEAFSRRFTYKLELPSPDRMLRIGLWQSHLPVERLADDIDIEQLADLGLTGGEIRLVIERTVRLLAYRGLTTIDRKTLTDIAREELTCRMKQHGKLNKIGFGAANNG